MSLGGSIRQSGNNARAIDNGNGTGLVQVYNPNSGQWQNAMTLTSASGYTGYQRAQIVAQRLNNIFLNASNDLEFITPGWVGGGYGIIWANVTWGQGSTTVNGTTYPENLYSTTVTNIVQITSSDASYHSSAPYALALEWANNIRGPVNGINVAGNPIYQLNTASNSTDTSDFGSWTISYYGAGEAQPSLYVANGEFFHPCDLIVAKSPESSFSLNTWINLTNTAGGSIVARIVDQTAPNLSSSSCATIKKGRVDLSKGGTYPALGVQSLQCANVSSP
ncbi:hypothetical protein LSG31_09855 [Fodinisporobacter ferrooxydans]|uniref:Uncharacterized protein n=1 Tax=Fodinisporobacter ferrooxydans TaxID=2901836 RepID=A0ABY4CPK4_9BACL|nr:hypothetical protein LSG31_09855 [Alicyclobacillaceae bacterium MYW30-H2]